jgi:hypothetical protein
LPSGVVSKPGGVVASKSEYLANALVSLTVILRAQRSFSPSPPVLNLDPSAALFGIILIF